MSVSIKSSVNNGSTNPFTPEEDAFILANLNFMTWEAIATELNKLYGRNRTKQSVILRNYNYLKGSKKDFSVAPIGTESFDGRHWWVKVKNEPHTHGRARHEYRKNWAWKHQIVWEQAHGKLRDDQVIIFLDGNPSNCEIENLYAVTKKVLAMMCRYKWHFDNVEAKKTAIRWCELYYALKN